MFTRPQQILRHFTLAVMMTAVMSNHRSLSSAADAPPPPSSQASSDAVAKPAVFVGKRRADVRGYLQRQSGARPEKPTIPRGKPADHFACYTQYAACKADKRKLYAAVAQHLRLAEALLEQEPLDVKQSGLCVVWVAMHCTLTDLADPGLAVEICDVWLMPHIESASPHNYEPAALENMLTGAVTIYLRGKAYEKAITVAWRWLRKSEAERNFNAADTARMQIAVALEGLERYDQALRMLDEIQDPGLQGAKRRIPELRTKRDEQLKKLEEEPAHAPPKK